jgi:hypothetical protein
MLLFNTVFYIFSWFVDTDTMPAGNGTIDRKKRHRPTWTLPSSIASILPFSKPMSKATCLGTDSWCLRVYDDIRCSMVYHRMYRAPDTMNPTSTYLSYVVCCFVWLRFALLADMADPQLLFGPYNDNAPMNDPKHCSWDAANVKNCNHHDYKQGLIHRVHDAGAEIYPAIGGWTLSNAFPAMAANAAARTNFAQQCVDLNSRL